MTMFEFDCLGPSFLYECQSVSNSIVVACVETSIGRMVNQSGTLNCSPDGFKVNQDLIQRHRHSIAITEDYIPEAVTDENDVNAGLIYNSRSRVIVRSQTTQTLASLLAGAQRRGTDLFRSFRLQ